MNVNEADQIGQRLMLAFEGARPSRHILEWLANRPLAGVTLFRELNVTNPAQVRVLTNTLQNAAAQAGQPPLIIAADQEGGQLVALGDQTTQFPGNMALGAAGDPDLAFQAGQAVGRELAAMGINLNYAPVCDVNSNPNNPNVGVRAFGDDQDLVARMGSAMINGLQSAGVAATAKHFPGSGESAIDPHFGVPILEHQLERLEAVEFRPFKAAIAAGVRVMMTAHIALPALTGKRALPSTLSRQVMHDLLRGDLGFNGLLISDALDMKAITQGQHQIIDIITALRAGVDLLLLSSDRSIQERTFTGLKLAASRGLIESAEVAASFKRVINLKSWLAKQDQPGLDVVGCAQHRQLETLIAEKSITLVRNDSNLLPIKPPDGASIAVLMPQPSGLTPADTSSFVTPMLAEAVRNYYPKVDEYLFDQKPQLVDIASLRERLGEYDLLIVGTTSANLQPEQASLVNSLSQSGVPIITVALRTPYDLCSYPLSMTHICTFGIQSASMDALAAALFGEIPFQGKLPVSIPGEAACGHGLTL